MPPVTPTNRNFFWGTQTGYLTQKLIAANAFRKIIAEDKNFVDHQVNTNDDAEWSHGYNNATEQWLDSHDSKISHTIPGHIEEMARPIKLAMGGYQVATPAGGTNAKEHTMSPQDPTVSRQLQAATYGEKIGAHDVLMPSSIVDGWNLKGNDKGILMLDFGLQGSGKIVSPSGVNVATNVVNPTNLHKLFNTQVGLVVSDGVTPVTYGCKYRSFELSYKNNLLLEAGYKPGCNEYQIAGDPTSGVVRSELLFDKQEAEFNFEVDMEADSGEFDALVKQKPLSIVLTATGDIIEGAIARKLTATMPKIYYKARKIGEGNGLMRFQINAKVFTDITTGKSLEVKIVNDIATYATW